MATSAPATGATLHFSIFNGAREPFPSTKSIIYRAFDGSNNRRIDKEIKASQVRFPGLPVFDNLQDRYRVIVSADDHEDAGIHPVIVKAGVELVLELMLVPKNPVYKFGAAKFENLKNIDPAVPGILTGDLNNDAAATRWGTLFDTAAPSAACVLNILTVMAGISVAGGKQLLGFLKQALFDHRMKQDRFYAWADNGLIPRLAGPQETPSDVRFAPAIITQKDHPGGTRSFKEQQFSEANLQVTFHENDAPPPGHPDWVLVEPDIDYFADPLAHFFLEVVASAVTQQLTDPKEVLALRWMAMRRSGRTFNPLYVITANA